MNQVDERLQEVRRKAMMLEWSLDPSQRPELFLRQGLCKSAGDRIVQIACGVANLSSRHLRSKDEPSDTGKSDALVSRDESDADCNDDVLLLLVRLEEVLSDIVSISGLKIE